MGQSFSLFGEASTYMPIVSFIAGLGGSLHCVGMCGGLVTASCERNSDILKYQSGRLFGYLVLGFFAGQLGEFLKISPSLKWPTILSSFLLGGIFIFWGLKSYSGRKAELPVPNFFSKFYGKFWRLSNKLKFSGLKALVTGGLSIFLPCGLLYGVALGAFALQDGPSALYAMFFFWLGTLPSMVAAPHLIRRVLKPLSEKLPKVYAISLVLIGLVTIGTRLNKMHYVSESSADVKHSEHKMMCH